MKKNIDVVKEYMRLAYSPKENKGAKTVQHLCHDDAYFIAPSTFPTAHSPQDYAQSHSEVMSRYRPLSILFALTHSLPPPPKRPITNPLPACRTCTSIPTTKSSPKTDTYYSATQHQVRISHPKYYSLKVAYSTHPHSQFSS
jgi:hypothetical protein